METSAAHPPADRLGRPLRDLRISVTDRCNFRCPYCMPRRVFGPDWKFLPRDELLHFEEIERLARLFVELGVRKIRLTGGEPLLRRDLPDLVRRLACLGDLDLALTTNGSLLPAHAGALRAAGLRRLTVSLDSLDEDEFHRMNDNELALSTVLDGIAAAERAGFERIKINSVVVRGVNEDAVLPLVEHFGGSGHVVRFIEYMDVGATNQWRHDQVVPARELLAKIASVHPLEPIEPAYRGEVAKRWRRCDGGGEIGFVTSVSEPFCGDCTRARLSAEGRLYTCLFAKAGHDLRAPLRDGASDDELRALLGGIWQRRADRYSELRARSAPSSEPRVEMSYLGG
jgi:cyclic pyranopterin phosphate synthase